MEAVQALQSAIVSVQADLDAVNEAVGKVYWGKSKKILADARQLVTKAQTLRVDVESLEVELTAHVPPKEGAPDYQALLDSLPVIAKLTNEATPKLDAPGRCAKISKAILDGADAAKAQANAALDGDPDHPRDSEYWKFLRRSLQWVQSSIDTYGNLVAAKYPAWKDVEKELEQLKTLWTPKLLNEIDQGQARAEKRVGKTTSASTSTAVPDRRRPRSQRAVVPDRDAERDHLEDEVEGTWRREVG